MNGPLGKFTTYGEMKGCAVLRSHGGRVQAIQDGEVHIDIAVIAAPTADAFGNANALNGKSACGILGYSLADYMYADKVIIIVNKVDLLETEKLFTEYENGQWIPFSVLQHKGFEELELEIQRRVYQGESVLASGPLLSNVRQISALERCNTALKQASESIKLGMPWDILSIDLREALYSVSEITGHNVQESLLEDIFSRFCIGK